MPESATRTTVTKSTVVSTTPPVGFNIRYFRTFHFLAKLLETICCLSVLVSSLVATEKCIVNITLLKWSVVAGSFVDVVSAIGLGVSGVLTFLCLFGVWWKIPATMQSMIEFLYYAAWTIMMMTSTILCGMYYTQRCFGDAPLVAASFSAIALATFAADAVVAFQRLWSFMGNSLEPAFFIPTVISSSHQQTYAP